MSAAASGATALIAVGSNLAHGELEPADVTSAAMEALSGIGRVAAKSRLWRSPAWPPGGPDYVKAAALVEVAPDPATGQPPLPEAVLVRLNGIEAAFGRERRERWASRTLDLDLLAMGGLVRPDAPTQEAWRRLDPTRQGRETPTMLVLPHPRLQDRGFVLLPLAEVAPGWQHPLLGRTVLEMLAALPPEATAEMEPLWGE